MFAKDKRSSLFSTCVSDEEKSFKCLAATEVEECLVGPTEYQTNELNSGLVNIQHSLLSVIISSTNILPSVCPRKGFSI
jgi:hypothetical protein